MGKNFCGVMKYFFKHMLNFCFWAIVIQAELTVNSLVSGIIFQTFSTGAHFIFAGYSVKCIKGGACFLLPYWLWSDCTVGTIVVFMLHDTRQKYRRVGIYPSLTKLLGRTKSTIIANDEQNQCSCSLYVSVFDGYEQKHHKISLIVHFVNLGTVTKRIAK